MSSPEDLWSLQGLLRCLSNLDYIPSVGEMPAMRLFFFLGKNLMLSETNLFQFLLKQK